MDNVTSLRSTPSTSASASIPSSPSPSGTPTLPHLPSFLAQGTGMGGYSSGRRSSTSAIANATALGVRDDQAVVRNRRGNVLTRGLVLKTDHFAGSESVFPKSSQDLELIWDPATAKPGRHTYQFTYKARRISGKQASI
jgi:hypothetical protein